MLQGRHLLFLLVKLRGEKGDYKPLVPYREKQEITDSYNRINRLQQTPVTYTRSIFEELR
jgi:hypothetical protein